MAEQASEGSSGDEEDEEGSHGGGEDYASSEEGMRRSKRKAKAPREPSQPLWRSGRARVSAKQNLAGSGWFPHAQVAALGHSRHDCTAASSSISAGL